VARHALPTDHLVLNDGDRIGKSFRLVIKQSPSAKRLSSKIANNQVTLYVPFSASAEQVQQKASLACEKALRLEAEQLLPIQLKQLAKRHGYSYKDVRIKKLTGRWGSCSNYGQISLSYYLIQLPWQLIDYVIIHELVHTRHHNHGTDFWDDFKTALPEARRIQKQIRQYKPTLLPST
jgi:predicted metal-dependent hydrolase